MLITFPDNSLTSSPCKIRQVSLRHLPSVVGAVGQVGMPWKLAMSLRPMSICTTKKIVKLASVTCFRDDWKSDRYIKPGNQFEYNAFIKNAMNSVTLKLPLPLHDNYKL